MSAVLNALREGKRNIEEKGWIQNEVGNGRKGFCAMGAVECVDRSLTKDPFFPSTVYDALSTVYDALTLALPSGYGWGNRNNWHKHPIAIYNNEPGRTKEEILALFDRAIEKLVNA